MTDTLRAAHQDVFRRPQEEHLPMFAAPRDDAADQRRRAKELEARDLHIRFGESGDAHFSDQAVRPTPYSLGQFA